MDEKLEMTIDDVQQEQEDENLLKKNLIDEPLNKQQRSILQSNSSNKQQIQMQIQATEPTNLTPVDSQAQAQDQAQMQLQCQKSPEIRTAIPILDVVEEYEKGNFGPMILALHYKFVGKDYIEPKKGFHAIHHAACFNNLSIIKLLVERFHVDPCIQAQNGQNCLMISCSFGFMEQAKYFIDKGVLINATDSCHFSALLYAVKANHNAIAMYLIGKGADLAGADLSGCSSVHWAAFNNNVWLLHLFKRLGLSLCSKDAQLLTPFQRAVSNYSYDTIKFIGNDSISNIPKEMLNDALQKKIGSDAIEEFIVRKLQGPRLLSAVGFEKIFWRWYGQQAPVLMAFLIYSIASIFFLFYAYTTVIGNNVVVDAVFLILMLYFILYVPIFIFRVKQAVPAGNGNKYKNDIDLEMTDVLEHNNFNKSKDYSCIVQGVEKVRLQEFQRLQLTASLDYANIHKNTTFHIINYLFETNRFDDLAKMDISRYCPTCLECKPPKTKHCSLCKRCVPDFNHHSYFFDKCINAQNHFYYLALLCVQEILLILYIELFVIKFQQLRTASWYHFFFETCYLAYTEIGLIALLTLIIIAGLLFQNTLFLSIEIYGIAINQTYNEIFNRQRYRYLYEPFVDKKGKVWLKYANLTSQGLIGNISLYFQRLLKK